MASPPCDVRVEEFEALAGEPHEYRVVRITVWLHGKWHNDFLHIYGQSYLFSTE